MTTAKMGDAVSVQIYTQVARGQAWMQRYRQRQPHVVCVLGFTETGLVPGVSAAGATPQDRQYTAIADAEFLVNGPQVRPRYPLPPLQVGASPVLIARAVIESLHLPVSVLNAGLPVPPAVPCEDLGGRPARCLSGGNALDPSVVWHLLHAGWRWGEKLAARSPDYLILGECVVGGTTTALAVLTGLGFAAQGKVNSSHSTCNHGQKWELVQAGWLRADLGQQPAPLDVVAALGDPMQVVVAGIVLAASRSVGVLLAGGTQMLAVYALARAIAATRAWDWQPDNVVVGTTRWVAEDPTGDTVGLAELIGGVPLLATQLSFAASRHAQLRAYEQGFVKEGVAAGGCAIAAHLYRNWGQKELLRAIDGLGDRYSQLHRS
jgi:uncharacterized protein (TIGR00303 family)